MRHLPIPTDQAGQPYAAGAVFRVCIAAIDDPPPLIDRMNGIIQNVEAAEILYGQQASTAGLHHFQRQANINGANGIVTTGELKYLYNYRMLNENQPGRRIYDRLKASGGEKCPLCGVNTVKTLDHHLPKAKYPILSVTPNNLVPSCRDCQGAKKTGFPKTTTDQTLHPYYDNVEGVIWLTATVGHTSPPNFIYDITPPAAWGQILTDRVRHHMEVFKLHGLFADNAASDMSGMREYLTDLFNKAGVAGVQAHLAAMAASWRAKRLNTWQGAMYEAAAADNWFCNTGFALI